MRWDFGAVYKEIREAKGLSQSEVCGNFLSRTSLAKFESGKVIPKYENMEFLLRQIDMSFGEFEYICHLYQPSERQEIFSETLKLTGYQDLEKHSKLLTKCENYLKTHEDIPIQRIFNMLNVTTQVQKRGILDLPNDTKLLTEKLWEQIAKQDNFYESDLKLLNAILFHFSIDRIHHITEIILKSLEKYQGYSNIYRGQVAILSNLATIYLSHQLFENCNNISSICLEKARKIKRYDTVGLCYVRLGICQKDLRCINKGLHMLETIEENYLLAEAQKEVKTYYPIG